MLPVIPKQLRVQCVSGAWIVRAYNSDDTEGAWNGFVFATREDALKLAELLSKPWNIPIIVLEDGRTAVQQFRDLVSDMKGREETDHAAA